MPNWTDHSEAFVPRHTEAHVRTALSDTRIVAIVGPRQSGKTTLARRIAESDGRPFVTLDDEQFRRFARDDPAGFIRGLPTAVIDEIQRAPDLLLELKRTVDENPRPGRYLITGSVELFKGTQSPDSLAGRVETIELLPFSQAEIAGADPSAFLDRAFSGDFPPLAAVGTTEDLIQRVVSGGFPEALSRDDPQRRRAWLRAYVRSLAERDAPGMDAVGQPGEMARLTQHAATVSGQLLNLSDMGARLGVTSKTADRRLLLLEQMFLVRRVGAWHRSGMKRLVKTPKLQFLDSGLLSALRRVGPEEITKDRQQLGPLLEGFVHAELAKAAVLSGDEIVVSHYRNKDKVEVDLVLERPPDGIVGIEVKATATARPSDFRGLKQLQVSASSSFTCGILLHDGERIQQTSPRLFAMPVKMLWEA